MSKLLKHYAKNDKALKVLKDPAKLKQVLFIIQEATDEYMNDVKQKLADTTRSAQQKAQDSLSIAQAIIKAEKRIRELEIYNIVGMKSRGMSVITDV